MDIIYINIFDINKRLISFRNRHIYMEENGLTLLKQEMYNEEIHVKVNAIHRMKTVILSIGQEDTIS